MVTIKRLYIVDKQVWLEEVASLQPWYITNITIFVFMLYFIDQYVWSKGAGSLWRESIMNTTLIPWFIPYSIDQQVWL